MLGPNNEQKINGKRLADPNEPMKTKRSKRSLSNQIECGNEESTLFRELNQRNYEEVINSDLNSGNVEQNSRNLIIPTETSVEMPNRTTTIIIKMDSPKNIGPPKMIKSIGKDWNKLLKLKNSIVLEDDHTTDSDDDLESIEKQSENLDDRDSTTFGMYPSVPVSIGKDENKLFELKNSFDLENDAIDASKMDSKSNETEGSAFGNENDSIYSPNEQATGLQMDRPSIPIPKPIQSIGKDWEKLLKLKKSMGYESETVSAEEEDQEDLDRQAIGLQMDRPSIPIPKPIQSIGKDWENLLKLKQSLDYESDEETVSSGEEDQEATDLQMDQQDVDIQPNEKIRIQ